MQKLSVSLVAAFTVLWLASSVAAAPRTPGVRTATPTSTTVPTRTATPEPQGCCQVEPVSSTGAPFCGNRIQESDCFEAWGARASFCLNCECSSHSAPGFTFDRGTCVTRIPTVTATPTASPTATATATPAVRTGCCRINTSRPGPRPYICGNAIEETSCLNDFGRDATFCAECVCSTHSGPGFGTSSGSCIGDAPPTRRSRPTRMPRPTRPARPTRVR